jgi:hypothetical protein
MPLVLPSSALQAGELDLRTVLPLCVQVLDLGGGPANGARLLCAAAADDSFLDPASAMQAHADRSGRVVLPVLPGNWFVMALTEHGIAHAVVKAAPGLAPQTLPLRALDRMRVRVVDGDGRPVHGAAFSLNGSSWSVDSTGEDAMLRTVGWHVSQWTLQRGASDARGNADLSFFAWKGLLMRLEVSKGDLETRVPRPEASDERIEVVLK